MPRSRLGIQPGSPTGASVGGVRPTLTTATGQPINIEVSFSKLD